MGTLGISENQDETKKGDETGYGMGEDFPNNIIAMKHFCFLGLFRGFQV